MATLSTNFSEHFLDQIDQLIDNFVEASPKVILLLIVLLFFWGISRLIKLRLKKKIQNKVGDPLLTNFIIRLLNSLIFIIGLVFSLHIAGLGNLTTGLLGTAGLGAIVFGFAFRDIGEHLLAGILLAFDRPFRLGDVINSNSIEGKVEGLNLRNTHIKTQDGKDVFIPNGNIMNGNIIKNPLTNYTIDGFLRQEIEIGIDHNSNVRKALEILLEGATEMPGVLKEDRPSTSHISKLDPRCINIRLFYWIDTFDTNTSQIFLRSELTFVCLQKLTSAIIYMPDNILEVKN